MKKNQKNSIGFVLGILAVIGIVFFVTNNKHVVSQQKNISDITTQINSSKKNSVHTSAVTIVAGDTKINLVLPQGSSLYDALVLAQQNKQIIFSGTSYPSLGFFVTDIGVLHSGNGKNLLYYINGKEAQVGISSYQPKDGDTISWKLE